MKTIDLTEVDEVPALANRNAFNGLPADYKVLVKKDMYDQFTTMTNWSHSSVINHIATL